MENAYYLTFEIRCLMITGFGGGFQSVVAWHMSITNKGNIMSNLKSLEWEKCSIPKRTAQQWRTLPRA